MEILIPAAIYLIVVSYIIVKLLNGLYHSDKDIIRMLAIAFSGVFFVYLAWELVGFFRNEHGKSFTVGWFALAYMLVTSSTVFAIVCLILRLAGKRL
jgi:hypothetical protein